MLVPQRTERVNVHSLLDHFVNFLLLEDGKKFLYDRSIHRIFEAYLINSLRFS